jgi:hypothetical protein
MAVLRGLPQNTHLKHLLLAVNEAGDEIISPVITLVLRHPTLETLVRVAELLP